MLHLPHSVTQRSSFAHSASAWVCLWNAETKPKILAICFICSRLKPLTQQQQQQTTGVYSHICYRDLGQYHFIVCHTICIKQQFSVPTGLAWLKAVSDVQKGISAVLYVVPQHYKLSQFSYRYITIIFIAHHCRHTLLLVSVKKVVWKKFQSNDFVEMCSYMFACTQIIHKW